MTDDEDRWQAALSGAPSSAPTRRATRLERAIIIGALADTACLLAFVPVAHFAGLGAVSLALIPAYTIVPLLVFVGGFAVRSRGRVHPGVWMSTVIATLSPTSTTVAETFPLAASTLCIADSP